MRDRLSPCEVRQGLISILSIRPLEERFVKRIPCRQMVKVLTDDQVESIHEASLRILETTGLRFDSGDARQLLVTAGATSHPVKKDVVTFPRSVVEAAIRRVPREVTYFARDPALDIRHNGEYTFPYAVGGNPQMIDIDTGVVRLSTYADVEDAARLGDALENCCHVSHLVIPNDVPPEMIELRTMEAAMRNSAKVMSHHATSAEAVDYMVKMWSCVSGGEEELRKRPLFSLGSSPISPLTYPKHVCDVLIRSAEHGVPFSVIPCPISGGTGPVTLAGSLALQNAETLAGLVLIQTVAPSLPSVYCGRVCFMDMRTGRDLWGVPEEGLVSAAMVQLAKRYKMVADTCGTVSDVTGWGIQMGSERMMAALVPMMAGAESISGIGDGWEGASSLEMMVIDNDIFDNITRIVRGLAVDYGRLGSDLVDKAENVGILPAQPHTTDHMQKDEARLSLPRDRRSTGKASREGLKPLLETARDRVKNTLREHSPMPLDKDVEKDIGRILRDAQKVLVR
jgi:trimethylamine--corrinoid protein Co-methyltransferase